MSLTVKLKTIKMDSERWQKVKGLFDAVVGLSPDKREKFLVKSCGGDDELRREVENLIASSENADSFMEQAAIGEVAEILVGENNNLQVGARFNHYEILSHLGAGGMGEVYLAEDTKLHRRVALKLLPASLSADKNANRRLLREAQSAAALNHPHICQIHEIGEAEKRAFIVMQFCEGATLAEKLKKENLSLRETLDLAIQIADALADAHSHQVIHRDIKPENIIVNNRGQAKILDFGLAKIVAEKSNIEGEAETAQMLSAANLIIGTPPYMSPEQAKGKPLDARSDIFSFGAMLYEMLSGKQVFKRESHAETLSAVLNYEPPFAKTLADAPTELQRILQKSLAKDTEKRYQTAKDLLIDLQNVKHESDFQDKLERTAEPHGETKTEVFDAAETTNKNPKQVSAATTATSRKNRKPAFIIGALFLFFAVSGLGYWFFANRANTKQIESIAVMPFVNESGSADVEYLSDGMTETLISSLSQIPKLNVKARSSVFRYKGDETNLPKIAKELNVHAILTGRVIQRGNDLTLYITLVDAETENVLWQQTYNKTLTNLVALQNDIARDVADNLKVKLSRADEQKLAKNYPANAEAYQLYLKGNYEWKKHTLEDLRKAIEYYNQALEKDPNYALAYTGLSASYGVLGNSYLPPNEAFPKAKAYAAKALAIDDTLSEAHTTMGANRFCYDWDWAETEKEFKRAQTLNPNNGDAHQLYAEYLNAMGRFDEALAEAKLASELDPLSPMFSTESGFTFYYARQYDEAAAQFQKTISLEPHYADPYQYLGQTYEQKKMYAEAIATYQKGMAQTERHPFLIAALGHAYAVSGEREKALKILDELREMSKQQYISPYLFAIVYAGLGDKEQTFAWLEKAFQDRSFFLIWLKVEPQFDSVRDDPRFKDLLRRIGLQP